jgi:hypothetical protein
MKAFALCLGLSVASAIHAAEPVQAKLVGQRLVTSFPGPPVLVCRYAGPEARYEVVAATDACAPFLELSDESKSLARPAGALARTSSP